MRISDWSSDVCSSDLGHRKDPTSFYLDDFPNYVLEEVSAVEGKSSTQLRNELFHFADSAYADKWLNTAIPYWNVDVLRDFMQTSRSEERRVGKECGNTGRSRWSPYT